ncbi:hypothetical protein BDW22DRAFT_1379196 [Trametopsis cervina]|nr:hypothetical protein BDW22DRAFT_1379196 [Trametopsis cervina]
MSGISQWHTIRPWRPTLALIVREITSVSATFILSSPLGADSSATDQSLASLGLTNSSDEDFDDDSSSSRRIQIVSDVLSKGLSVKVNGTPWQRVLMKIDDEADEAVIILFGLMPGRQYDVELGIVPNEKALRSQITTETSVHPSELDTSQELSSDDINDLPSQSFSSPSGAPASTFPPDTSPSFPSTTLPQSELTPPSSAPSFSLEDRRIQLTHMLSMLNNEHSSLTSTLKSARRDAQKADAALRAEIEALKRASERSAPTELRARQKARALQEAARQALAAAESVQAHVQELENALPALLRRKDELEQEWGVVERAAKEVSVRREEAEGREKKRAEGRQAELASLSARLDRLTARREKLDAPGGTINELEERLRRLEEEREQIERDPYGYSYEEDGSDDDEQATQGHADSPVSQRGGISQTQPPNIPHMSRKRHSNPVGPSRTGVQPIARPDPIQRPGGRVSLPPAGPGVIHLQPAHIHSQSVPSVRRTPPSNYGSTSDSSASPPPVPGPSTAPMLSTRMQNYEQRGLRSDLNPSSTPFEPRTGILPIGSAQVTRTDGRRGAWP